MQISTLQQGMNIDEDVSEAMKNSIEALEYDFEHDEKLFINMLENSPAAAPAGSTPGSSPQASPSPQGPLAIKDDDQYPPQVLFA